MNLVIFIDVSIQCTSCELIGHALRVQSVVRTAEF